MAVSIEGRKMRYLRSFIEKDLEKKIVLLGGPRQVGKTTLAQSYKGEYFNWDNDDDRQSIINKMWDDEKRLLVFDELHKRPKWKTWIKGIYDKEKNKHSFLVTGSARLDVYRKGGDSLLGRCHHWRLHPFTLDEHPANMSKDEVFKRLMSIGGFPEPFIEKDPDFVRRWRKERFDRVIREDIRDLENIRDINSLSLFADMLRSRVGGMIEPSNMARDIQVAPKTALHWLDVLEKMYIGFSIKPFTKNISRSIVRPPKFYFFDNGDVIGDEGSRFENLIATHLLKRLHFIEDSEGYRMGLHYLRDKDNHEVDFVISRDGVIEEIIEAKLNDNNISSGLIYFKERHKAKRVVQIVANLSKKMTRNGVELLSPLDYFSRPPWDKK